MIAGTGGEWQSESGFLSPVLAIQEDLENAWEAAHAAAIAEIITAHTGGNGA